jgi:hypothetical protein
VLLPKAAPLTNRLLASSEWNSVYVDGVVVAFVPANR